MSTKLGLNKWIEYCKLMILGLSKNQCTNEVDIDVITPFCMWYRILDVIKTLLKNDTVVCIVEVVTQKVLLLRCLEHLEKRYI